MAIQTVSGRDYISPGLDFKLYSHLFPHRIVADKDKNSWPFLRRHIDHNWYVDERQPTDGFINIDETSILVAVARSVGGAGLEIGSLRGWSTVHIAGVLPQLDAVDVAFADEERRSEVRAVIEAAQTNSFCTLHAGESPEAIHRIAQTRSQRWSFFFVDGDHHGCGPKNDAEVVDQYAEDTAAAVFHDLTSPDVAAGLEYLFLKRWKIKIYHTMQIMGVAYRGSVELPRHVPDPHENWDIPMHLRNLIENQNQ